MIHKSFTGEPHFYMLTTKDSRILGGDIIMARTKCGFIPYIKYGFIPYLQIKESHSFSSLFV